MGTDRYDCRDCTDERDAAAEPAHNEVLAGEGVLDAELPSDLQSTLGRFLGRDPVATLGDWAREIRDRTDGDAIAVADLCHADAESAHWGTMDRERYYFACFYDAIVLAALEDERVRPVPDLPLEDVPMRIDPDRLDIANRVAGEVPFYLQEWVAVIVLLAWGVGPVVIGYRRFVGSDVG